MGVLEQSQASPLVLSSRVEPSRARPGPAVRARVEERQQGSSLLALDHSLPSAVQAYATSPHHLRQSSAVMRSPGPYPLSADRVRPRIPDPPSPRDGINVDRRLTRSEEVPRLGHQVRTRPPQPSVITSPNTLPPSLPLSLTFSLSHPFLRSPNSHSHQKTRARGRVPGGQGGSQGGGRAGKAGKNSRLLNLEAHPDHIHQLLIGHAEHVSRREVVHRVVPAHALKLRRVRPVPPGGRRR